MRSTYSMHEFANALYEENNDAYLRRITPFGKFNASKKKEYKGRWVMVEAKEFAGSFSPATHFLAQVVGWDASDQKLIAQTYNLSGEKDGPPMAENFEDLWALPRSTDEVSIKEKTLLPRYNKSAMQVEVQPIITTPVEVQPKKRKATKKKTATTATKQKKTKTPS